MPPPNGHLGEPRTKPSRENQTQEHMLCDSIYLKFKNKHRSLTVTESEQEVPLGSEALMEKGHDWGPGTLSPRSAQSAVLWSLLGRWPPALLVPPPCPQSAFALPFDRELGTAV